VIHNRSTILLSPHTVFKCFVWISEQTALISLFNIKLVRCYNRAEKCLLRGTDWMFKYGSLRFVCKGLNTRTEDTRLAEPKKNTATNFLQFNP
jgi:hypothetical protein